MSTQTFKKGVLASSIAMILAGVSSQAIAAEESAVKKDEVEVIQVTGIRGSLKSNINAKKFADAAVDVINAEDIGKFPDKNVAESLQRIPGITVQRQFGEGAGVSIRGAGVDLTQTSLNGQNVASTGWFVLEPAKRSFNYELLPSEIVGGLEVYKTSQADILEGGVGGTVIVNTRKPLDLDANTVYGSVEAQYADDSGKTDPQFSGMYSWKNDEENFGILVSGVSQERNLLRQGSEAWWAWGAGPVSFEQERERSAISAVVQYAPTDSLSFTLNAIDMKMAANNTNYALWLTRASGDNDQYIGAGIGADDVGSPVSGPLNVAFWQARPREATMNSNVLDLTSTYEGDTFTFEVQLGKTESTGGTDFEMVVNDGTGGTAVPNGRYDFSNGTKTWNLSNDTVASYRPNTLGMGTGEAFNRTPKTDDETYVQADIEFQLDHDLITTIKAGVRASDHNSTSRRFVYEQADGFNPVFNTDTHANGKVDVGTNDYEILAINVDAVKAWAKDSIVGENEDFGAYSEIQEDSVSAYVMASYSGENYRGNFGVRYVQTDAESVFYREGVKVSETADYSEFLPSFNLAYDLSDDLILRTAAARVIARPQYNDMYVNPSPTGTNDEQPDNQKWTVGNIGLEPFRADQFDIGLEWYFNESSLLSGAVFFKKVKNFVTLTEYHAPSSEIPFALPIAAEHAAGWTVFEKHNGKDANVHGLELQYQQDFGNGFGAIVNYTLTHTSTDKDTFTDANPFLSDSSEHTYNVSGYFENDTFSTRLSYNWRSEYMLREVGYGNRMHDDFGSLDLSAVYHLNDNVDLKFDAVNLLGEDVVQKGYNQSQTNNSNGTMGFPAFEYTMATRVNLGVTFRF